MYELWSKIKWHVFYGPRCINVAENMLLEIFMEVRGDEETGNERVRTNSDVKKKMEKQYERSFILIAYIRYLSPANWAVF